MAKPSSTSFPVANTEILKIGNDKYRVHLLYDIGNDELRIRLYASRASTIALNAHAKGDVVRYRKGHCQLCGGRFDTDDPRTPQKPEWCTDCYERFVMNHGKFRITNMLALTGYVVQLDAPSTRLRKDERD